MLTQTGEDQGPGWWGLPIVSSIEVWGRQVTGATSENKKECLGLQLLEEEAPLGREPKSGQETGAP